MRGYLRRRAGTALGLGAVGIVGLVLLLAWAFAGAQGWSPGTPVPLVLLVSGLLALALFGGWVLRRLRGWSREERLAGEIERSASLPQGSVRAQVELAHALPGGVSSSLARAGEAAVLGRIQGETGRLAGRPGRQLGGLVRIAAGGAALAVVSVLAASFLGPERARAAWSGLVRPAALLATPLLPPLELLPGDVEIPRGDAPEIAVRATGRDSVTVHWQAVGDVLREARVRVADGVAETRLPPLDVRVRYWASSRDGARTSEATLTPSDPSVLSEVILEVAYPAYTRLPLETFRAAPAWLRLPEGSELRISGGMAGIGDEVRLLDDEGGTAASAPVASGLFEARWRPLRSGTLRWEVVGGREGGAVPPPLEIEVVPDAPPTIDLHLPEATAELPLSMEVPVSLEASDDYGVSWVEIETLVRRPGEEGEPVLDRIPTGDRTEVLLGPRLSFSGWGLGPGDEVLLRARAADGAPEPHLAETPYRRLVVPRAEEVRDSARESVDQTSQRTEDLLERAREEAQQLRDLERRSQMSEAASGGNRSRPEGFEDREELRDAVERQTAMAEEVEQLRQGLEDAGRALQETMPGDPQAQELRERIEGLERQLEEIADPETRERLEELGESLREGEMPATPEEVLEELGQRQSELEAQLEQALEQLRRAELEEDFRGAEEEIQSLMDAQSALADELSDGQGEEAQTEQAERTEALESRLEELQERLDTQGEQQSAERTRAATEDVEEARQSMEQAAQQSREEENETAASEAEQAAQELEQALQELQETREEMAEEARSQAQEELRRGAQDALSLARRQSELQERMSRAPFLPEGELEEEAAAILEGVQNLQAEVEAAAAQSPQAAQDMSEALSRAAEAAAEAVEGLQDRVGPSPDPQGASQAAQGALNEMAMMAVDGLGGSGGESAQQGSGGEASDEEDLTSLSEEQQSVNEQTERLSEQSGPDGTPVPADLEDIVAGQRGVAAMLREMAERRSPGVSQNNLDALSEESEDIADELEGGRLDATTRGRQEQFLERLLTAGRTLERDGPTEEREGTTGGAVERRAITALPEELLQATGVALPTPEELEALPPGQRQLVLDYFDRVNRRRASERVQP